MSNAIAIKNAGRDIISTNYWTSDYARNGILFLSWNAGAARLLVPKKLRHDVAEMKTAESIIVSRGPWTDQGGREALELLFEDYSDSPYSVTLVAEQCDRLIPETDQGGGFIVSIWTKHGKQFERPGKYRTVESLPCLQQWSEQ